MIIHKFALFENASQAKSILKKFNINVNPFFVF